MAQIIEECLHLFQVMLEQRALVMHGFTVTSGVTMDCHRGRRQEPK